MSGFGCIPRQPKPSPPIKGRVWLIALYAPFYFPVFEESRGFSRPDGVADDFEVSPRDLSQVKRHEVVVFPRLRLGIINSFFLIFGYFGDDAPVVAGFASDVAEAGDVFGTFARLLEFVGAGAGVAGNSIEFEV